MTMQLSSPQVMTILVRREFLEQRLLFLYAPLACVVLAMLWYGVWLIDEGPQLQANRNTWPGLMAQVMYRSAEGLMLLVFWFSMAYYYLYTLYQQRKDRSILFWNSLPVADAQTVFSKVLAGLVLCQGVYVLCFTVLDFYMQVVTRAYFGLTAMESWGPNFDGVGLLGNGTAALSAMPFNILWCLPVYGWLLLASAWSRRAPFAWATGPWVIAIIVEVLLYDRSWLLDTIVWRLLPISNRVPLTGIAMSELALGALAGCAFLYAAVRLNRSDDS